jgi:hypothetical protein
MRGMPHDLKPPTERIPLQTWVRTPQLVRAERVALAQELAEVKRRLEKAEEPPGRNSQNCSQPPSQDRPEQKPAHQADLPKTARQRGGQNGQAGHHRELLPVEQVDQVVIHRPEQCAPCGAWLVGDDAAPGTGRRLLPHRR